MLNTVVRQIAFVPVRDAASMPSGASGELPPDRHGRDWLDIQRESLGPAFDFDDEYRVCWAYIPHVINTPFYVYAYAFGDCLVNALYGVFQSGPPRLPAEISRHAARRRHQAAQGAACPVRARRIGPCVLEARASTSSPASSTSWSAPDGR